MSDETENKEQLVQVESADTALECITEDPALYAGMTLPTMDDITDQIVYKSVKDVCRGFSFDPNEMMDKKFQDIDQIANYVLATEEDIRTICHEAEANDRLKHAAAIARFWYMAYSIDKALKEGDYGTGASTKIAAKLHKSIPMVYSIRQVGNRLTASECYLLGMRKISSTTLRRLAALDDEDHRKGLINAFINAYSDTQDMEACEKAKKQFIAAINMKLDPKFLETATSDPVAGGSTVEVSELYTNIMQSFGTLEKVLKKLNGETFIESFCNNCVDFSITDSVPDAEEHVETVKDAASRLKTMCLAAKNNLDDAIRELDSISGVEVITNEGSNNTSN